MKLPEVGHMIGDRYRVERKLGEGGMGIVFLVRHVGIERDFALKLLSPRLSFDENYRERFEREARINARLRHPNVVQVFDNGTHQGLLYMVMELLNGMALSDLLWSGQLTELSAILQIGQQIADALTAAHQIGLIHRDLKPENVLVETHPDTGMHRCVLLDFGLAFIQNSDDLGRLTRADELTVAGTPLYMSPEQLSAAPLSAATDIYAFGCMMYELLTGKTPFEGEAEPTIIKIMTAHMFQAPKPLRHVLPDLPLPLDELVMLMLSKDASMRPTAVRVAEQLREIEHLPASHGRGGVLRARRERQVQGPTQRDQEQLTTGRFFSQEARPVAGVAASPGRTIGLWRCTLDDQSATALASVGFATVEITDDAQIEPIDLLLTMHHALPDVARLSQQRIVVMFVQPELLAQAAELLRAGVSDVLPLGAGMDALTDCMERAHKRSLRMKKRRGGA